jgi:hypothetical protein
MDLTPYINKLREDMAAVAGAGDEQTRRTAALLTVALEPTARLAIMNALSDLAAEVTATLDGPVVSVRLDGQDVAVAVDHVSEPRRHGDVKTSPHMTGGDVTRITLRVFEELKSQAEQAAATQGVSLNTWLSHAVQGALKDKKTWHTPGQAHGPENGTGNRVKGWVQG